MHLMQNNNPKIIPRNHIVEKILIDVKDILGRSITSASHNRVVFRIYNDGSVSKQLNVN